MDGFSKNISPDGLMRRFVGDPMARAQKIIDQLTDMVNATVPGDAGMMPQLIVQVGEPTAGLEVKETLLVFALADGMENEESKYQALRCMGRMVAQRSMIPLAVGFASEAWMAAQDQIPEGCQPRHALAKKEVIMLAAMGTGAENGIFKNAEIIRDAEQNITLGEWNPQDEVSVRDMNLLMQFHTGFAIEAMKIMTGVTSDPYPGDQESLDSCFTQIASSDDATNAKTWEEAMGKVLDENKPLNHPRFTWPDKSE